MKPRLKTLIANQKRSCFLNEKRFSADDLRKVFSYDASTGEIWWKIKHRNTAIGARAGRVHAYGYRRISIEGVKFPAHRIIWALHYGEWPAGKIDHENTLRDDNRIENLRPATDTQNCFNKGISRNNRSGFKGVGYCPEMKKKWRARISAHGVNYIIGYFDAPEEAHAAYVAAAEKLHGEFARAA